MCAWTYLIGRCSALTDDIKLQSDKSWAWINIFVRQPCFFLFLFFFFCQSLPLQWIAFFQMNECATFSFKAKVDLNMARRTWQFQQTQRSTYYTLKYSGFQSNFLNFHQNRILKSNYWDPHVKFCNLQFFSSTSEPCEELQLKSSLPWPLTFMRLWLPGDANAD